LPSTHAASGFAREILRSISTRCSLKGFVKVAWDTRVKNSLFCGVSFSVFIHAVYMRGTLRVKLVFLADYKIFSVILMFLKVFLGFFVKRCS